MLRGHYPGRPPSFVRWGSRSTPRAVRRVARETARGSASPLPDRATRRRNRTVFPPARSPGRFGRPGRRPRPRPGRPPENRRRLARATISGTLARSFHLSGLVPPLVRVTNGGVGKRRSLALRHERGHDVGFIALGVGLSGTTFREPLFVRGNPHRSLPSIAASAAEAELLDPLSRRRRPGAPREPRTCVGPAIRSAASTRALRRLDPQAGEHRHDPRPRWPLHQNVDHERRITFGRRSDATSEKGPSRMRMTGSGSASTGTATAGSRPVVLGVEVPGLRQQLVLGRVVGIHHDRADDCFRQIGMVVFQVGE
jgi:hypothetical protein